MDLLAFATVWGYPVAKIAMAVLLAAFFAGILYYTQRATRDGEMYIRPIAGLNALNEAIGRATEMGRPILYVPGIADVDDIQTIASMVILGGIAKTAAGYDTRTIVPVCQPLVFPIAEEMTKNGYADAGRPDAFLSTTFASSRRTSSPLPQG